MEVVVKHGTTSRKDRLHQLFELARSYRNITMTELAAHMGRSPSNILRQGDNPKLDLIIGLATCLDWTTDEVATFIWSGTTQRDIDIRNGTTASGNLADVPFERLQEQARQAREEGCLAILGRTVDQMSRTASTVQERASALLHHAILAAISGDPCDQEIAGQKLVRTDQLPDEFKLLGLAQIAQAKLSLGRLGDANDHAKAVIRYTQDIVFDLNDDINHSKCEARAAAQEVRGHLACRQLGRPIGRWNVNAEACHRDTYQAVEWLERSKGNAPSTDCEASLIRCNSALLELDVSMENISAEKALTSLRDEISDDLPSNREMIESKGWACVYGADIAIRFLPFSEDQQRSVAVFSEKGFEIAEKIDCWQLRERLLTLDYEGHKLLEADSKTKVQRVIDDEDVRLITSTMRRFPNFRPIGLDILTDSELIT